MNKYVNIEMGYLCTGKTRLFSHYCCENILPHWLKVYFTRFSLVKPGAQTFCGVFFIQVSTKKATSSDKLKILQKAQIQSRGHGSVQPSEIS